MPRNSSRVVVGVGEGAQIQQTVGVHHQVGGPGRIEKGLTLTAVDRKRDRRALWLALNAGPHSDDDREEGHGEIRQTHERNHGRQVWTTLAGPVTGCAVDDVGA